MKYLKYPCFNRLTPASHAGLERGQHHVPENEITFLLPTHTSQQSIKDVVIPLSGVLVYHSVLKQRIQE